MADNPQIDRYTRRAFLAKAAIVSAAAATGVGILEITRQRREADQKLALDKLYDTKEPKHSFKVSSHPDIIKNGGLGIRFRRVDSSEAGDLPPPDELIAPGTPIKNAVFIEGFSLETQRNTKDAWIAFRYPDDSGATRIVFVANHSAYLEPLS